MKYKAVVRSVASGFDDLDAAKKWAEEESERQGGLPANIYRYTRKSFERFWAYSKLKGWRLVA